MAKIDITRTEFVATLSQQLGWKEETVRLLDITRANFFTLEVSNHISLHHCVR